MSKVFGNSIFCRFSALISMLFVSLLQVSLAYAQGNTLRGTEVGPSSEAFFDEFTHADFSAAMTNRLAWLRDGEVNTSGLKSSKKPSIQIDRFDKRTGLVAGYEATSGKRVVFAAKFNASQKTIVQVYEFDASKNAYTALLAHSTSRDASGQSKKQLHIADIDVGQLLNRAEASSANTRAHKDKALEFYKTDIGAAFMEGVPALYAAIELAGNGEVDKQAARLYAMLGVISMALDMSTKQFHGFGHVDSVFSPSESKRFKDACLGDKNCLLKGSTFTVYRNGLFDVMSDYKPRM
ncbi:MAG: hypothetical protein ACKO15_05160 [Burkholderiales bacterium]